MTVKIKATLDAVIFSNLFISLGAVALTIASCLIWMSSGDTVPYHLIGLIFFSTLFIYNFFITSYSSPQFFSGKRQKWISANERLIKCILILSLTGVLYNILFISFQQVIILIHLGVLSLLYVSNFKIFGMEFSIRKFSLLKVFVLAYVWSSVTVFLPALEFGKFSGLETMVVFFERFVFIFSLCIPFDIRDYSKDKTENVITIPGLMGIPASKNLSIALMLFYIFISVFFHGIGYVTIARIISGLLAIFLISKTDNRSTDSFFMFGIDGILVFHLIALVFLRMIFINFSITDQSLAHGNLILHLMF